MKRCLQVRVLVIFLFLGFIRRIQVINDNNQMIAFLVVILIELFLFKLTLFILKRILWYLLLLLFGCRAMWVFHYRLLFRLRYCSGPLLLFGLATLFLFFLSLLLNHWQIVLRLLLRFWCFLQ